MSPADSVSVVARAQRYAGRTAIVDAHGSFSYNDLLDASSRVAAALLAGRDDLREDRVAFLVTPGFPWVAAQWGIWRAGGIAVPLPLNSARPELEYFIEDSGASTLICDAEASPVISPIAAARGIRILHSDHLLTHWPEKSTNISPNIVANGRAMILYTSGTLSRPKGVVTTHANITAQITSLAEAWEWSADDRIMLCLRSTMCMESSMSFPARFGRVRLAGCCLVSRPVRRGTASPMAT